jgi:hypothetical protein
MLSVKLIVDGEWIVDPAAQKNVPNEHGSLNSVIEVRAWLSRMAAAATDRAMTSPANSPFTGPAR